MCGFAYPLERETGGTGYGLGPASSSGGSPVMEYRAICRRPLPFESV